MRNESPVGLATYITAAPAVIAIIIYIVMVFKNGGDVSTAQDITLAALGGGSAVITGALRQWRAVKAQYTDPTLPGGDEIGEEPREG